MGDMGDMCASDKIREEEKHLIAMLHLSNITHALKLLSDYKNREIPPTQYLESVSPENSAEVPGPLVIELFLSFTKMEKFLYLIVDEFCKKRKHRNNDDFSLLMMMLYVIIFKLKKESRDAVKQLLIDLHPLKSFRLLQFLCGQDVLLLVTRAASQVFAYDYVEATILPALQRGESMKILYGEFKDQLMAEKKSKTIQVTRPKTPNVLLHINKAPPPPCTTPEDYSCMKFTRALPATTFTEPVEHKILENKSKETHRESIELYESAQSVQFNCASASKSQRYTDTITEIEKERSKEMSLDLKTLQSSKESLQKLKKPPLAVKSNAATVLREAARLMKEEEKEMKRLQAIATGASCSVDYEDLEAEIRKKKEEENLEQIARKHLKGLLTFEEAVLAKQQVLERNIAKREKFRKEKEELERRLEEWKTEEGHKVKLLMEMCQNSFKGAKLAQDDLQTRRVKRVQEINAERRIVMEDALKKKEEELMRKIALIKEIKALQSVRILQEKEIDLTETPGIGLMCEMSIAELRERLCIMKIDLQEQLEARRTEIKEERARQQRLVTKTQEFISQHREAKKNEKQVEAPVVLPKSQELESLRQELEEKRRIRKEIARKLSNELNHGGTIGNTR